MTSLPWLVAPMGASAVLVLGVPSSPLAQPWSGVGGNTLSALVGIACARWLGPPELAAAVAVAVGAAIGLMLALRCLHPPGGAAALMMVPGGITDPWFAVFPVLLNAALLAMAGIAYNNATRRPYPHTQRPADKEKPPRCATLKPIWMRYWRVITKCSTPAVTTCRLCWNR